MKARQRVLFSFANLLALAFLLPGVLSAQTVLDRVRIGNNAEGLTYVNHGPYAKQAIVLDGYEVRGVPAAGKARGNPRARTIFDLRGLGIGQGPRGIAYIESERLFAIVDPSQLDRLLISDHKGRPQPSRTVGYPDSGFFPTHLEGLAYIPENSLEFPDHLALVAMTWVPQETRIEILTREGEVVREILPDEPLLSRYGLGLTFLAPDKLLVFEYYCSDFYILDFDGHIISGPDDPDVCEPQDLFFEGLVQLPDGKVAASDYFAGTLFFFDENLNRLPEYDRFYGNNTFGLGLPTGLAWDDEADEHLVVSYWMYPAWTLLHLAAIPPSLDTSRDVTDLNLGNFLPRRAAYLPEEGLIAVEDRNGRQLVLFDKTSGQPVDAIDLSAWGRPWGLEFIPALNQFAVSFLDAGNQTTLYLISRDTGLEEGTIDLSETGIDGARAIAFFKTDPSSDGKFLIAGGPGTRAVVTDFAGTLLDEFDYRETLGIIILNDFAAITSGPQAGAFAATDRDNSEIVVFEFE